MAVITLSRQLESGGDEVAGCYVRSWAMSSLINRRWQRSVMRWVWQLASFRKLRILNLWLRACWSGWFGQLSGSVGRRRFERVIRVRNDALQDLTIENLIGIINAGYKKATWSS